MSYSKDKTLVDNNRRALQLRQADVESVLPEYFVSEYPNLIQLFNSYYNWLDSDGNFGARITDLNKSRDVTQVAEELLQFVEDELLLGQSYFEGFINKREASKFSNLLYRSKGSLYSIQQFFRAFYGTDPEIIYPKERVFVVGESAIGAESQKYITDNTIYQTLAILVRIDLPLTVWEEVYKLFVHPAGMYLGAEVQLIGVNANTLGVTMPDVVEVEETAAIIEGIAIAQFPTQPFTSLTTLVDSDGISIRASTDPFFIEPYQSFTLEEVDLMYSNMGELMSPSFPSFDEDSDVNGSSIRFDNTTETFDTNWYDSAGKL
jgi:hypothetical protein